MKQMFDVFQNDFYSFNGFTKKNQTIHWVFSLTDFVQVINLTTFLWKL